MVAIMQFLNLHFFQVLSFFIFFSVEYFTHTSGEIYLTGDDFQYGLINAKICTSYKVINSADATANYCECSFSLCQGQYVAISTCGCEGSTYLRVFDSSGKQVEDDSSNSMCDSMCSFIEYHRKDEGCGAYSVHQGCSGNDFCQATTRINKFEDESSFYSYESGADYDTVVISDSDSFQSCNAHVPNELSTAQIIGICLGSVVGAFLIVRYTSRYIIWKKLTGPAPVAHMLTEAPIRLEVVREEEIQMTNISGRNLPMVLATDYKPKLAVTPYKFVDDWGLLEEDEYRPIDRGPALLVDPSRIRATQPGQIDDHIPNATVLELRPYLH